MFLLVLLGILNPSVIRNEDPIPVYKTGDDMAWASKDYNDKNWSPERTNTSDKIFWS